MNILWLLLKNNSEEIIKLKNIFNGSIINKINNINEEKYNSNIINFQDIDDIYNNNLTKAAIIGLDTNITVWARTDNFKFKKEEIEDLKNIFKQNINWKKIITLDNQEYQIIGYKPKFSIDIKNGDNGGTIAITNKGIIFGFFNSNIKYKFNGIEKNQCLEICRKAVEDLANQLKGQGY